MHSDDRSLSISSIFLRVVVLFVQALVQSSKLFSWINKIVSIYKSLRKNIVTLFLVLLINFYFAPLTNVGPSDGYIRSLWDLYRYVESSFHGDRNQHARGHWMPQMQYQSKSRYVPYFWTFNSQYLKRNPDWLFKYNKVETLEIAQRITIKVKSLKKEFSNFDINLWSLIKRRHFCI